MQFSLDYVFCAGLLLFTAGVSGKITILPRNTAAEVGSQITFDCTSDASSPNWLFSTNREEVENFTGQNIVINCMVQPAFVAQYDVEQLGGSNYKCNLIVKATTIQQAGVYTCTDIVSRVSSVLTVIARNTSIAVSSQPETVEGETVRMYYTVRYNSSNASSITPTIQPVLSWTDSDGNAVISSPASTANSVSSSISVEAGRQDIRPYTCHISYTAPSTKPSFATNTPSSVSNSPSTSTINVLCAPIISSITMSKEVAVCPGKTVVKITCIATANPAPTFSWIGPDSRTYSGATIEAVMNGTYTCNASNVIRGSTRSDMKETTLRVSDKCSQDDNTVIIIIVCIVSYILGNIIATVVFLVYYHRNIGFKLKLNDLFPCIRKMLPCMNENVACGCGWIFLSVCVFTLFGLVFIILMIIIAKCGCCCCCCCCSQERGRSEATVKHFHNPSDDLGPDDDDPYDKINIGIHSTSPDNTRKPRENQSLPNVNNRTAVPSSSPPNPHNEAPQHQQSTSAQGPVYSDLPVTDRNVQPEQYIAGNNDPSTYSELRTT